VGNFAPGDTLRGFHHLQVGEASTIAHVERFSRNALDLFQRAQVRIRNVDHVDVIAHAASVRRGIVEAENIELRDGSQGRVQHPGNQVRFFAMGFAARNAGARGMK